MEVYSPDMEIIETDYAVRLAEAFNDMLPYMESLYGKRDARFRISGIQITDGIDQPETYYPNGYDSRGCDLIIRITANCMNDTGHSIFQLAHESIHCLAPRERGNVTCLEEGLATCFSMEYTQKIKDPYSPAGPDELIEKYMCACRLTKRLLAIAPGIIRKMRKEIPSLSEITAGDIIKHCRSAAQTGVTRTFARQLAAKFQLPHRP